MSDTNTPSDAEQPRQPGTVKIYMKSGQAEVNYEGDVYSLEKAMSIVTAKFPAVTMPSTVQATESVGGNDEPVAQLDYSTSTIAGLLDVKHGSGLVLAAAAKLTFSDKKDSFSRSEIVEEMKKGVPYHKKTYINNLSGYIDRLVGNDELRIVKENTYSLSPKKKGGITECDPASRCSHIKTVLIRHETMTDSNLEPSGHEIKVRAKSGDVEIEYEGDRAFLSDDIETVVAKISGTPVKVVLPVAYDGGNTKESTPDHPADSTSGVADLFNVRSGPDLIMAAAAKLTFIDRKLTFLAEDLLGEMLSAAAYYDQAYKRYIKTYLARLVKAGKLRERPSKDGKIYSISKRTRDELERAIKNNDPSWQTG